MAKLIGARAFNSGALTIATGVNTALTFDSERYDTDAIHDLVVNPGRLTCKTAGKYAFWGYVDWVANAGGSYRQAFIQLTLEHS